MVRSRLSYILIVVWLALFWGVPSVATEMTPASSCLPSSTSLQTQLSVNPEVDREFSFALRSDNGTRNFETHVRLNGIYQASTHRLHLRLSWDDSFDGVSLPYNLYSALVIFGGKVLQWSDWTHQCSAPGLSFYPGGEVDLPEVEVPAIGSATLQIMIWGRIL